jgi:2-aminoethylphosphonate-pyruvate transaminase
MRRARYQRNAEDLITRMRAMGFVPLLADTDAGPILQTFLAPRDKKFDFAAMQESLRQRGFLISAGELAKRPSFRVSCIGQIDHKVVKAFSVAMEDVLKEQDVQEFTPPDA